MQNSIIGVFYFFEICLWNGVIAEKPSKKGVILSKVTRFYGTSFWVQTEGDEILLVLALSKWTFQYSKSGNY